MPQWHRRKSQTRVNEAQWTLTPRKLDWRLRLRLPGGQCEGHITFPWRLGLFDWTWLCFSFNNVSSIWWWLFTFYLFDQVSRDEIQPRVQPLRKQRPCLVARMWKNQKIKINKYYITDLWSCLPLSWDVESFTEQIISCSVPDEHFDLRGTECGTEEDEEQFDSEHKSELLTQNLLPQPSAYKSRVL